MGEQRLTARSSCSRSCMVFWHKAGIDHDGLAAAAAAPAGKPRCRGRKYRRARPSRSCRPSRPGRGCIGRRKADAAEFVVGRRQRAPLRGRRQRRRRAPRAVRSGPRSARASRPGAATARPRDRRTAPPSTSVKTPKPAALRRCADAAVISARGRSAGRARPCDGTAARSAATSSRAAATAWSRESAAATAAACTQNGGWYLTSTISAQATTMAPAIMMMKIAGPSPVSMKA